MDCDIPNRAEKLFMFQLRLKPDKIHWVECNGYRCLAVLNDDGKWLCFATGKVLANIIIEHCD